MFPFLTESQASASSVTEFFFSLGVNLRVSFAKKCFLVWRLLAPFEYGDRPPGGKEQKPIDIAVNNV